MTIDEMRQLDAIKTYKELEETKKTNAELVQRMKEDGEYIYTLQERNLSYHEAVLKYKEEIKRLTDKIEQLHAGAEEQQERIKRLEREVELFREYSNYGDVGVVDSILRGEEIARKEAKP
jgi:uncharacterized coiled-coil DUF342 family protein